MQIEAVGEETTVKRRGLKQSARAAASTRAGGGGLSRELHYSRDRGRRQGRLLREACACGGGGGGGVVPIQIYHA